MGVGKAEDDAKTKERGVAAVPPTCKVRSDGRRRRRTMIDVEKGWSGGVRTRSVKATVSVSCVRQATQCAR
jgi:hypothetical protein